MGRVFHAKSNTISLYLSVNFLRSALYQLNQAWALEENSDDPNKASPHFSCCVSTFYSIVSYLEAFILEYLDSPKNGKGVISGAELDQIKAIFSRERKFNLLKRYNAVLKVLAKPFETGENPYRSVLDVVWIRNNLSHPNPRNTTYEIEFISQEVITRQETEVRLKSRKLGRNPFSNETQPYYPYQCISAELCGWAVKSCFEFVIAFYSALDLQEDNIFYLHREILRDAQFTQPKR